MAQATFSGTDNTPRVAPAAEQTQKRDDAALDRAEAQRLANTGADGKPQQPGANKRAGAASRDPNQFDVHARAQGAQGDTKPVQDPVL